MLQSSTPDQGVKMLRIYKFLAIIFICRVLDWTYPILKLRKTPKTVVKTSNKSYIAMSIGPEEILSGRKCQSQWGRLLYHFRRQMLSSELIVYGGSRHARGLVLTSSTVRPGTIKTQLQWKQHRFGDLWAADEGLKVHSCALHLNLGEKVGEDEAHIPWTSLNSCLDK